MNSGLFERLDLDDPQLPAAKAVAATARAESPLIWNHFWLVNLAAWLVTAALLTAATLRVFAHDATYVLVWINAYTRYLYLPSYACLAWALWQRRWALLIANLLLVVCHVTWVAPDFERDRRSGGLSMNAVPQTGIQPTVRIFFANVRADNPDKESILEEIAAANPDVAVLVEFTPDWYPRFRAARQMEPYKYHTDKSHARVGLVNVFSKLPLQSESQVFNHGRTLQIVDVAVGSRTLRIIGLHAPRPTSDFDNYEQFWQEAIPRLTAEQGPVVVVGDFNATQYSRVYQRLTAHHLNSAHEDRGRGYATTWPNGRNWLPPIRIDQALLSANVECLSISEGVGRGSDHKPLVLDVALRTTD
jgi:endonuclease/exonuclease/phosphatase (EEP) superfamily protein YafD